MKKCTSPLAKILLIILLSSSTSFPALRAVALAPGVDVYIFASDESGNRYFAKSNGDGTFGTLTLFGTDGGSARGGAAEDFDNDAAEDVVMCNTSENHCYLRRQTAPGTFAFPGTEVTGAIALDGAEMDMTAADFNQDGYMDFVASGNSGMRIYVNDGAGDFTHVTPVQPSGFPHGSDAADFDGNGYPDLFVGLISSGEVQVYENAAGVLGSPTTILSGAGDDVFAVSAADFDGDGFIDVAAGGGSDGRVGLWLGDGNGTFTFAHDIATFSAQASIDNYDFDGDQDQDLVATSYVDAQVFYIENTGGGVFAAPVVVGSLLDVGLGIAAPSAPPIHSKVTGHIYSDLNGNGVQDDGAVGIELVGLSLTGTDYLGNPIARSTVTEFDGSYLFEDVLIDDGNGYSLEVTTPPYGLPTATELRAVSVPRENTLATENFLYLPYSTIQGTVFNDRDGNGTNDDGAGGWGNTELSLTGHDYHGNPVSLSTMSNAPTGAYAFEELLPSNAGGYSLSVTTPPPDTTETDSIGPLSAITITAGGTMETRDFGFVGDSLVQGQLFGDEDGNGVNDDTPGAWAGYGVSLTVTLTGTDFDGNHVERSTTSLPDGTYSFEHVKLSDAAGYSLEVTSDPPPELNHPTTPNPRTVSVNLGSSTYTEEFGYQLVCTDADADGSKTEGGLCGPIDCNDGDASIHPGAAEVCNGIDDNCDGIVDESFPDEDGDGVTTCAGDCDDTNPAVHPGATEICNGIDDDCDLEIDEGFDQDGDLVTSCNGDCDDTNPAVHPGATEICNGIDDDCDAMVDEGFDEDGDGVTTCAGDCNDTVHAGQDASLSLVIDSVANSGAGADMSSDVYVGDNITPYGTSAVTIPLTLNGVAIVDALSSPDVPGIHVQRGKDSQGAFVRISAYGHNATSSREIFTGNFALQGATVGTVLNGNGSAGAQRYEGQGDGSCTTGQPTKDEYVIAVNGTTGTLCSTTNTDEDNVTIYYKMNDGLYCNQVTDPETQCLDPFYRSCGVCIYPGADDPYGDGVDTDCDAVAECQMKKDYNPTIACAASTVVVKNDAELDAYLANYGLKNGKYQNLKIGFNISRPLIEIHSPCSMQLIENITFTGNDVCLDGRMGVKDSNGYNISAKRAAVLSEFGDAELGMNSTVQVAELWMEALRKTKIGLHTTTDAERITILSTGDLPRSIAFIRQGSDVRAETLTIQAVRAARIGPGSTLDVGKLRIVSTGSAKSSNARIGQNSDVKADSIYMSAPNVTRIGAHVDATVTGDVTLRSTGGGGGEDDEDDEPDNEGDFPPGAEAVLAQGATVTSNTLNITALKRARLGQNAEASVTGNFHMEAPECVIAPTASYTAGSTSGSCLP